MLKLKYHTYCLLIFNHLICFIPGSVLCLYLVFVVFARQYWILFCGVQKPSEAKIPISGEGFCAILVIGNEPCVMVTGGENSENYTCGAVRWVPFPFTFYKTSIFQVDIIYFIKPVFIKHMINSCLFFWVAFSCLPPILWHLLDIPSITKLHNSYHLLQLYNSFPHIPF